MVKSELPRKQVATRLLRLPPVLSLDGLPCFHRHGTLIWAGLTFLLLTTAALFLSHSAAGEAERIAHERFEFKASEAQFAIRQRLIAYEQVLRGGIALFEAADNDVSRGMWRTYVTGLAIQQNYPGIQGIGYAEHILPNERAALIERVRSEGFPDFDVVPAGVREEYTAIVYLEPFDWRNKRAFGYDMFSEPVRRKAMERARDSGQTAISGKVILVQETEEKVQNGFLMYLPLCRDGGELLGYVYAPFRMHDLMYGILRSEQRSNIRLQIFDGADTKPEALLYDSVNSSGQPASDPAFTSERRLLIGGHGWTIRYTSRPLFDATIDRRTPLMILIEGTAMAFLIGAIVWSLSSNRKRARQLARVNNDLHQEIEQRTKLEVELVQAKEAAEAASRAKSTFLANMSHELRTPLNAVLGYVQMFRRDRNLTEWQAGAIDTIRRSSEHLLTLISDILDLSKIEVGKLDLAPHFVSLIDVLRGVAEIVRVRAEEKSLAFFFDLPSGLPPLVQVDDKRLRQVLLNLLGNAVKFTDDGHIRFRVEPLATGDADIRLRFRVEDTGIGIAEDKLQRIFEPFEQVADAQRRSAGTGLGLSITRDLVRLMGSEVQVSSSHGQGSEFWFDVSFPIAEEDKKRSSAERAVIGFTGERKKVLIVDDTPENRQVLSDLLLQLGFEIVQANDGQQALEAFESAAPDLILMDVMMPVMDGLEATRRIRQLPARLEIPIIAVSASVATDDQARSLEAGANAFLPKPIDHQQLCRELGRLLYLQWIEEAADESENRENEPLIIPPVDEMQQLHDLARAGNMRRIRAHADRIAAQDERYAPFSTRLLKLAASYDSQAILRLVAEHLQEEKGAA